MDPHSEERLQEVHSELANRVRTMESILAAEGRIIRITQGVRSWSVQQELYNKGRDGEGNVTDKTLIVTNAPPGHSWHQFGLAVDVAPFDDGIPDWNINHPVWQRMVQVGWTVGLDSGSKWRTFPDWPHFQLGGIPESPSDEIRQTFLDGGMEAVWAALKLQT